MTRARGLVPLAFVAAVFASQFAHVRVDNSSGHDEWLYRTLSARGIIGFPYQNRPLVLLWHLPPALAGGSLADFYAAHATYLLLGGLAVFAIVRRAAPAAPLLAYLAACLAVTWAPMDHARLLTVTLAGYAGWTLVVLLATLLFVEACRRSSPPLLLASAALSAAGARGAEATLPLIAAGPVVAWWSGRPVAAPFRRWIAAWGVVVIAAAAWAVVPVLRGGAEVAYQSRLGLDLEPAAVLARLVRQLGFHLLPVVTTPAREVLAPGPLLTAALLAVGLIATWRAYRDTVAAPSPRETARAAAAGLALAGLGYAAFTVTAALPNPVRTQFLSAFGIAVLLAAAATGLASFAGRGRLAVLALAGGWVAAAGTANTIRMQRDWDRFSRHAVQSGVLRDLTAAAPGLVPNTLVILLDDDPAFPATFTFQHAIEHAYGRHVRGIAWGAAPFLYEARRTADGFAVEPWPVIREPWDAPPTAHRFDEIVVARRTAGRVEIAREWPPELGEIAAGARYEPSARIVVGSARPLL